MLSTSPPTAFSSPAINQLYLSNWGNFIFLRKFGKEMFCFLEKCTQLEKNLHDHQSWRSRKLSSLYYHQLLILHLQLIDMSNGLKLSTIINNKLYDKFVISICHEVATWISWSCWMDLSILMNGFLWFVTWTCRNWFMNSSKFLHGFVKFDLWISQCCCVDLWKVLLVFLFVRRICRSCYKDFFKLLDEFVNIEKWISFQ